MNVIHSIAELDSVPGPVIATIGVFDGVHLGHQALIRRALADAKAAGGSAVVVTFDPHPMRVLRPDKAPRLLTSTRHKIALIERQGISHLLIIPFTREFAEMEPELFVAALQRASRPLREICVGHTWCFGKGKRGNLELMKEMGDRLGFDEVGISAVEIDGEIVSSTLIRATVQAGDLTKTARLLGRDFSILGTVEQGDHVGRTLGFPTANLGAHNEQFPPNGVYAVEAAVDRNNGERLLPGVVNIGVRPTLKAADGERLLELHLFDFNKDLYGSDVEVFFRQFLRPEQKFNGLDALKAQIALDVEKARAALAGRPKGMDRMDRMDRMD